MGWRIDNLAEDIMDTMPDGRPIIHLGDGAYAIYERYGVWLHANHHLNPTDRIWLENYALEALNRFVQHNRDALVT